MAFIKRQVRSSLRQKIIDTDREVRSELKKLGDEFGELAVAQHQGAVRNWQGKPKFAFRSLIDKRGLIVNVVVMGRFAQRWHWIDKGTGLHGPRKQAYEIRPKRRGGVLRFQTGYQPKTLPIGRANLVRGRPTGPWRSAKVVIHPGIRARKFTETFRDELRPEFRRLAENSLRRAARRV